VTEGEIYVILGLFMLTGIIQKPALRLYFTKKKKCNFHTGVWRHYNTRQTDETISNSEGPRKLLKILPVIPHLNCISQIRTYQLMNY
jgi:hypothetical protein